MKKILIISAHPDDMETGLGGTGKILADAGFNVHSVVTTLPPFDKTYPGFSGQAPEVRMAEGRAAHRLIGLDPRFVNFGVELDVEVNQHHRDRFSKLAEEYQPDVVFIHWPVDVNPDHRAIGIMSMEYFLQKGRNTEIFCFEVFSDPGRPQSIGFHPTHYVDIGSVVDVKQVMVECHGSQSDHLWEANEEMQALRGSEAGVASAEAFVRLTRWGDLPEDLAKIFIPVKRLPAGMGIKVDPEAIGLA